MIAVGTFALALAIALLGFVFVPGMRALPHGPDSPLARAQKEAVAEVEP